VDIGLRLGGSSWYGIASALSFEVQEPIKYGLDATKKEVKEE